MAEPIELLRGTERQTVYSPSKASTLMAEGWQRVQDLTPEQQEELRNRPPLPWMGYDDMTVGDIAARLDGLTPEQKVQVTTYESATKQRRGILDKLEDKPTATAKPAAAKKATPAKSVEAELEAETGHDVVKTGSNPPTFVETDAPAPGE